MAQMPVGRFAELRKIVLAVVFLASHGAAMFDSADVIVDGGYTAK